MHHSHEFYFDLSRVIWIHIVRLQGIEPQSIGYRPTALPLSYKRIGMEIEDFNPSQPSPQAG